jgi:hypothetical protein
MRNIHVRFEYEEALEARRSLLSSHVNLLEFHEKFKAYKNLRRRELILRVRFKRALASLNTEINSLWESLPSETEEEIKTIKKVRKLKTGTKGDRKIKDELQEIKEKLARLGRP